MLFLPGVIQAGMFNRPPQNEETCFSPDEACDEKLVSLIDGAKKTIDIAIYDINLDALVHSLLVQSKKIKVRVVVDRKQAKGKHSAVPLLLKAGVNVRYGHQRGIMHNKFVIVDGTMLESGSFNYTHHAYQANHENQIYLTSPKIVARFQEEFEKVWRKADEPRKKN